MWIFFSQFTLDYMCFLIFLSDISGIMVLNTDGAGEFSYFTKKEHGLKRDILPYPKRNLYNPRQPWI